MIVHSNFSTSDKQSYRFRRVLPDNTYTGVPGVYALTHVKNFPIEPLMFKATNDLGCIEQSLLDTDPQIVALRGKYQVGVAVFPMPRTSAEQREAVALALNSAINDP